MPPPLGYAPPRVRAEPPTKDCADRKIPLRRRVRKRGPLAPRIPQAAGARSWSLKPVSGTARSGIGGAWNNRRQGLAIQRAHMAERLTRALSVAIPVLAYICR